MPQPLLPPALGTGVRGRRGHLLQRGRAWRGRPSNDAMRVMREVATEVASVAKEMVSCCEPHEFTKMSDPPPGTRAATAARLWARDSAT
eukprot:11831054-Heterocapsa_arctica.AAC.1